MAQKKLKYDSQSIDLTKKRGKKKNRIPQNRQTERYRTSYRAHPIRLVLKSHSCEVAKLVLI